MKRFVIGLLLTGVSAPAWADCASLPYPLTNGTVANADQVMADLNCLALTGGDTFSGPVLVQIDQNAPSVGVKVMNLGVGVNAQARVDMATHAPNSYSIMALLENNGSPYFQMATGTGVLHAYYDMPDHIFRTQTGVERMRITTSGNVGIGTASPSTLFYVNGSAGGTQSWNQSSDRRLKTNIHEISGGIDTILRLRPVRYNWRAASDREIGKAMDLDPTTAHVGFIAQEVAQVIPEAVDVPKSPEVPYSMRAADIVPFLVQAVKEQQAQIKALEAEVAALKAR